MTNSVKKRQEVNEIMKDELRIILKMLPTRILREIAYKKQIKVRAKKKEDIINILVEEGKFDKKEIKDLRELVRILDEEKDPVAQYMLKFSEIDLLKLKSKFEEMSAQFDSVGELIKGGYEILEYKDGELLRVRKWDKKEDYYIDTMGRPMVKTTINTSEITIDLKEKTIFIHGKYGSVRGIKRDLTNFEVQIQPVGLLDLERKIANERFQDFINELESELREVDKKWKG